MQNKERMPIGAGTESAQIRSALGAMQDVFARELTPELSRSYIGSLSRHIGPERDFARFVERGREIHRTLGRDVYGPLIVGFLQWAQRELAGRGITGGPVHFALRDAWPFYTAAHVLWDGTGRYHAVGTYVNRPLMGIEDEIARETASVNGYVREYLASSGFTDTGKPVALIDSGAWGTVVREIKERYLPHTPFYPLFWYSHNPAVPGFINHALERSGLPPEFGEVINDSLECVFPQAYRRPVRFDAKDGGRFLTLEKADPLSVAWGQAALEGVAEAAHAFKEGITDEAVSESLKRLYELHVRARSAGQWTGVLPTHTPTWSKGPEFLAEWPERLLP